MACLSFAVAHEPGECAACHRVVPLKKGYCRLCWMQASLEAKGQVTVLEPFLREVRHQQLSFAGMQRWGARVPGRPVGKHGRRAARPRPEPPAPRPVTGWVQLKLFDARKDYTRFDRRRHADLASPWLARGRAAAQAIGEARGWTRWVTGGVDRALVILLSGHADGDEICYSEMFPALRAHGLSVERTAEVLAALGLFRDDRVPAFETWLERSLAGLAPGIRADVEHWLRTLRHGGPRSRPRAPDTAWVYLRAVAPALTAWSGRYGHLREVTSEDILEAIGGLAGHERQPHPHRHPVPVPALQEEPHDLPRPRSAAAGRRAPPQHHPAAGRRRHRPGRQRCPEPAGPAHPRAGRHPRRPDQGDPRAAARRHRPRQPAAHHRRPDPAAGRPHPPDDPRLAQPPPQPLARYRQPSPHHQPADRHGNRPGQQGHR